MRRLTLRKPTFGGGDGLQLDQSDLELAREYSAIQKTLKKFMQNKVEHQMHFQNAAREDKNQRFDTEQLNKMLNSEFASRMAAGTLPSLSSEADGEGQSILME